MSTIWTVIEEFLGDAAKTDELVRTSAARREIPLHPGTAITPAEPAYAAVGLPIER